MRAQRRAWVIVGIWIVVWAAAGGALVHYHSLVMSEGPCAPGAAHCGMAIGYPFVSLGVVV
jgi:hypothetical protein